MKYLDFEFNVNPASLTVDEYMGVIDILEDFKPKRICELDSGQSSQIFETYCDKYNAKLYSIEHDSFYENEHSIMLPLIDEETNININGHLYEGCNKYDGLEEWLENQDKFDFILIDGPYGYGERLNYAYSRIQLLSFILFDKITDNAYVLYHDSERENAKPTLNEFERLLTENNFIFEKSIINDTPELTIYKINKTTN